MLVYSFIVLMLCVIATVTKRFAHRLSSFCHHHRHFEIYVLNLKLQSCDFHNIQYYFILPVVS
jgi:hypothetical protein